MMSIFKISFAAKYNNEKQWDTANRKNVLALDAETAIKIVKKDALTFTYIDEPDSGNIKGNKIKVKTKGFRLLDITCLGTAEL